MLPVSLSPSQSQKFRPPLTVTITNVMEGQSSTSTSTSTKTVTSTSKAHLRLEVTPNDYGKYRSGKRLSIDESSSPSPLSPSRKYQDRLILPFGSKEIEFTVPQTLSPLTPTFGRKGLHSGESSPGSLSGSRSETDPSTSRANTPSPVFFRGGGSDTSGACSLGVLNPALYKSKAGEEEDGTEYPENHFGRVWYALEYEMPAERLLVNLIKVRNLGSRNNSSQSTCNPFVRVSLFPDERRTLQSKPKNVTSHPQFEETFGFQISRVALDERSLKLCFYDADQKNKHTMLGYIIQPLKDIDWSFGKQVFKEDLVREIGELSPNIGEVLVSLCYNSNISRLTVTLFEAKGIKSRESASGLYAKVTLIQHTKIIKSKKTSTVTLLGCRSNFNESFNFKLPSEMLDTSSVSIQLMYAQPGYNKGIFTDQTAGRIVLGSFMFARGKGLDHWQEMVAKQKEQIQYWHAVSE